MRNGSHHLGRSTLDIVLHPQFTHSSSIGENNSEINGFRLVGSMSVSERLEKVIALVHCKNATNRI